MGPAYYNEIDPYAAQWLRNLIAAGHIAAGDVDERSIADVRPDDLKGYVQCHFFAGIGGWSYAARLAGWPDDRPLWTGSCPCQPYSLAGKGLGQEDERDLWPIWFGLVAAVRPATIMGEQVKDAIGKHWLDRMRVDLEGSNYAIGATVLPACAVDAPHRRDRLWFVANATGLGSGAGLRQGDPQQDRDGVASNGGADAMGNAISSRLEGQRGDGNDRHQPGWQHSFPAGSIATAGGSDVAHSERSLRHWRADVSERGPQRRNATWWSGAEWVRAADGKARRVEPSIRLLAHGVPARVGKLRAYGNAIVPQVAAEVIGAYLDAEEA